MSFLSRSSLEEFDIVDCVAGDATYRTFKNAPRNLFFFYRDAVDRHRDAPFFVYEHERFTFGEAWERVARLADAMLGRGIVPGDRIGIAMRNYPEWAWAFLAATSVGAIAVCLNSWWSGGELEAGVRDSGAKLLFVDAERLERVALWSASFGITTVAVRCDPGEAAIAWPEFVGGAAPASRELDYPDIGPEHPATILYTSGSTSTPKGVLSTHRALIHAVMGYEFGAVALQAKLREKARGAGAQAAPAPFPPALLVTAPLFHVTALNSQFLLSLRLGRKIVAMRKWDAEQALALIERERVTQFSGVPTMVSELMNSPRYAEHDLSSLEAVTGGGAVMTPAHAERVRTRSGGRVSSRTGYAMTETNGLAASHGGKSLLVRPSSVGRAQPPLVSIKIVDAAGRTLDPRQEGEILIHGAMNFSRYWNDPKATARTIRDGWVHSGDLGYLDEEGFLFLTDRLKDVINRGGEKVSCLEVETALLLHEAVFDAVVFGLPDARLGEIVACVCELQAGASANAEELTAHLAARLAAYKLPVRLEVQHSPLPRLPSGKVDRRAVKAARLEAAG